MGLQAGVRILLGGARLTAENGPRVWVNVTTKGEVMDKAKLDKFFLAARGYMQKSWDRELEGVLSLSPETFKHMNARYFMTEYAWAVYGAGFGENVLRSVFPDLKKAFNDFDLDSMCKMASLASVLKVFNNKRKAECVLRGARLVRKEGFTNFKERLTQQGRDALMELPGIGPITKDLLARNIGLASVTKNDIWIKRLVSLFSANSHPEMVEYLADKFNEAPGVVDAILWRFCNQKAWNSLGYSSLNAFAVSLSGRYIYQIQREKGGTVMTTLVSSYDEVVANIRQFNSDLKVGTLIKRRLSRFTHWYHVPNSGFGPAKFIGYKNTNTSNYLKEFNDKHGGDAEVRLREWFRPLSESEDSSQYRKLYSQLVSLLFRHGRRKPRSNVIIHVPSALCAFIPESCCL
jgi:hypothetical protein